MPLSDAKFSAFLAHRKQFIQIRDTELYKRARVQLHWKGIVLRDEVEGALVKTKNQQVARRGELLVAEIDAKVGGVGIVPPELDGAIVSSHYFLFEIDESKCLRPWLDWFIRSGGLADQFSARGSTNYAAIRPHHVLNCEIPLPPLDEQRRIVSRIEELHAKVEKARILRSESISRISSLMQSRLSTIFDNLSAGYGLQQVGELITEGNYGTSKKCSDARLAGAVPVLRIPNVASELINRANLKYAVLSDTELRQAHLREGDVLVVRTNGSADLVGRCAVVPALAEPTAFASYLIRLRVASERALADYLQLMLKHLRTNGSLIDFARTTAGQYNVSLGRLRTVQIPLPPMHEQQEVVNQMRALEAKIAPLKSLQVQTRAELDALMPSILSKAFCGDLL
jgi:type I restriction enzyme S subunit